MNRVVAPDDVLDAALAWAAELAPGAVVAQGLAKARGRRRDSTDDAWPRGWPSSRRHSLAVGPAPRTRRVASPPSVEHGPGKATFVGR